MSGIVPRDPYGTPPDQWKAIYEPITAEMWQALREAYPGAERLLTAFRLAPDVDTCSDLLAGAPVSESRLDPAALGDARRESLVQLRAPLELVNVQGEAAT